MVVAAHRPLSPNGQPLTAYLAEAGGANGQSAAAVTIAALAGAAARIARLVGQGPLGGAQGAQTGDANADGDPQVALDLQANALILAALRGAPVAYFASEEAAFVTGQTLSVSGGLTMA